MHLSSVTDSLVSAGDILRRHRRSRAVVVAWWMSQETMVEVPDWWYTA